VIDEAHGLLLSSQSKSRVLFWKIFTCVWAVAWLPDIVFFCVFLFGAFFVVIVKEKKEKV